MTYRKRLMASYCYVIMTSYCSVIMASFKAHQFVKVEHNFCQYISIVFVTSYFSYFLTFFYMYIGHNDIERYCKTVIIICIHLCRNFIQFVKVTCFFKYMYMIFNFGQSVKTKLLKLSRQNSRAAFFLSSYVQHNFITKLLQTTYLLLEPIVKKT